MKYANVDSLVTIHVLLCVKVLLLSGCHRRNHAQKCQLLGYNHTSVHRILRPEIITESEAIIVDAGTEDVNVFFLNSDDAL